MWLFISEYYLIKHNIHSQNVYQIILVFTQGIILYPGDLRERKNENFPLSQRLLLSRRLDIKYVTLIKYDKICNTETTG